MFTRIVPTSCVLLFSVSLLSVLLSLCHAERPTNNQVIYVVSKTISGLVGCSYCMSYDMSLLLDFTIKSVQNMEESDKSLSKARMEHGPLTDLDENVVRSK